MSLRLKPLKVTVPNPAPLIASAAALAKGLAGGEEARRLERVTFQLGAHACALDLQLVTRAVTRLGDVAPLLGSSPRIKGIAFIDNVPHAVADLLEATGAPPRTREALAAAPALVVAREGWKVAVAVDAPLDLVEGELTLREGGMSVGGVELAGRQGSGALVVAASWFEAWLDGLT